MRNSTKKVLSVIFAFAILLTSFSFSIQANETTPIIPAEGATFKDRQAYRIQKNLTQLPLTMETWINPADVSTYDGYSIFGNMYSTSTTSPANSFSFRLINGRPTILLAALNNGTNGTGVYMVRFNNSRITTANTWVHVAVTVDIPNAEAHCYINGVLKETLALSDVQTEALNNIEFSDDTATNYSCLGGRYAFSNNAYNSFNGRIGSFAAYSDIRTADEIAKDYLNYKSPDKSGLLFAYDLDGDGKAVYKDLSGNENHVSWLGYNFSDVSYVNPPEDYDYSMIVVGDTQMLTKNEDTTGYYALYDWIAENAESKKVEAVIGVGDITNNNTAEQWQKAVTAFDKLDGMRHFPVIGNHDISTSYGGDNAALYKEYILYEDISGEGGNYDGSIRAYYKKFDVGEHKYLFLGMGYMPKDEEIEWAKGVLEANPDRSVILSTHAYLEGDGTLLPSESVPEVREQLVMAYSNIVLVLCGHRHDENVRLLTEKRADGTTVQAMFTNPQDFNIEYNNGVATMLYFTNNGKTVNVGSYIPSLDTYLGIDSVRQFKLDQVHARGEEEIPAALQNAIVSGGFQIRSSEYTGLRSLFTLDAQAVEANELEGYTLSDYGVVTVSEDTVKGLYGGDIDAALEGAFAGESPNKFIITSVKKVNKFVSVDAFGNKTFCISLTGIPESNYQSAVYSIAYADWELSGEIIRTITVYTSERTGKQAHSLYDATVYAYRYGVLNSKTADDICLWDILSCGKVTMAASKFRTTAPYSTDTGPVVDPSVWTAGSSFTYFELPLHAYTYTVDATSAYGAMASGLEKVSSTGITWSLLSETMSNGSVEYIVVYRPIEGKTDALLPQLSATDAKSKYPVLAPYETAYGWKLTSSSINETAFLSDRMTYSPTIGYNEAMKIKAIVIDDGIIGTAGFFALTGHHSYTRIESIVYPEGFTTETLTQSQGGRLFTNQKYLKNVICAGHDRRASLGIDNLIDVSYMKGESGNISLCNAFENCESAENILLHSVNPSNYESGTFAQNISLKRVWVDGSPMPEAGVMDLSGIVKKEGFTKNYFDGISSDIHTVILPNSFIHITTNAASNGEYTNLGEGLSITFVGSEAALNYISGNKVGFVGYYNRLVSAGKEANLAGIKYAIRDSQGNVGEARLLSDIAKAQ